MGKQTRSGKPTEWEAIAASQNDQQVESLERAKKSTAANFRLAERMAATKLYEAYTRHPLAARVMTFKEFKKPSRRDRILKSFKENHPTSKNGGDSE
jgi:hypothetical protein